MDYYTKKLLGITDENITFPENWLTEMKENEHLTYLITGKLSYQPTVCEKCGEVNNGSIICNGTVVTSTQLLPIHHVKTVLKLHRTRFLCRKCNCTFVAQTPIVDRNHHISKKLKFQIALDLTKIRSRKEIGREYFVSDATILRIQREFAKNHRSNIEYLPETLCIDEFKSMKSCTGSMRFICVDGDTGRLLEILENRQLSKLIHHFMRYSRSVRMRVKYLVMDMNASYAQLIVKKIFPNAKLIIDRFHVVQHINRSFNQLRIKIMNSFCKSNPEGKKKYRRLKRYWKLFLKEYNSLDVNSRSYNRLFKRPLTQRDMIDELLTYDDTLKRAYLKVQALKYYYKVKDPIRFLTEVDSMDQTLPQWFRDKFKVFKKYKDGIKNAFYLPFSNGKTEGLNNKIKVIKRISFGYRNFYHLRDRIYLIQGFILS